MFLLKILRSIGLGFFVTLYVFIDIILTTIFIFIKFTFVTLVYLSYYVYKVVKHSISGFRVCSYLIYCLVSYAGLGIWAIKFGLYDKLILGKKSAIEIKKEEELILSVSEQNRIIKEENEKRLRELRARELAEINQKRIEEENAKLNQTLTVESNKKVSKFQELINSVLMILGIGKAKEEQKALLLDFEGEDALKSNEKQMYKYVVKNPEGKIVKGYFPGFSKVEVHSFLLSEGNEVYSIETNKWIRLMYGTGSDINKKKIKTGDLIFFITQLSTYIKAGITLVEALKILSRQFKKKNYSRIFRSMIYDLSMGDSFSVAMDKQGNAFPRLLINMVKASEMTGELPEALDDMEEYFTETDKTRKQMITALTYPAIILVIAIIAIVFIMVWVVPQFVGIYSSIEGAKIPGITMFIMNTSNFLQKYYLYIILGIAIFIVAFVYIYKNIKSFKTFMQWAIMHMPVFGNVVIYNEVTMFTKTFASLLAHNVFITDSMEILNKLTTNEIYKGLIEDTINNLAKGEKVSLAFKDHWAFPIPAYEMITTGEMTGQLPEMMQKVSAYYQELHRNAVTRIKTFVEPAMILLLTAVVGVIVLSIVIPMFNMYTTLNY